jgi:iron-sulfur cluster assembly protein
MISLTELAAKKIKDNLAKRGSGMGIRVGVRTTGCSGMAYVLEYVDLPNGPSTDDVSFISHGVHVFVDPKSLVYLEGIEMDWIKKGLNEGFDFINPNEKDRCGCGESFRV